MNQFKNSKCPVVILSSSDLKKDNLRFLVDSGSELNIIKEDVLKDTLNVNYNQVFSLTGISKDSILTKGSTEIRFGEVRGTFNVVDKNFPIYWDGILGVEFLNQHRAKLCFDENVLSLKRSKKYPFEDNYSIELPPRSGTRVKLHVLNSKIKEGYIRRIPAGPGVFLGQCLASNNNGIAEVIAYNCTSVKIKLIMPPVFMEHVEVPDGPISVKSPTTQFKQNHHVFNIQVDDSQTSPPSKILTEEDRVEKILEMMDLESLNDEEKRSVEQLVKKYPHQFFIPGDKLGETNKATHKINLTDDIPINIRQYRQPPDYRQEIQRQVDELLADGIIQHSESPYNFPVLLVPKKPGPDGKKKFRLVIDYRKLNEKTIVDAFPLPLISDILDQVGNAAYFSTLDMRSGFMQVPLDPKDRHKSAFSTPWGHYEFRRMSFGLSNSPPTFQRLMNNVLMGLNGLELAVFIDDIVVYASSLEEHFQKMDRLMQRIKDANLSLSPEKCFFLRKEVTYLGHRISSEGVSPCPDKLKAVANFPVPKTKKNVKQALGLFSYYRKFIQNFALIAKPLTNLLKEQVVFKWGAQEEQAFAKLKTLLCTPPILQYPDFSKRFIVTCDASDFATGAVLSQGKIGSDLPIAYASRTLTSAEMNYTTTEKELLAMVYATEMFRQYLYGRSFTFVTDHKALVWLNNVKDPVSRLMRWKIKLSEFDYEVIHKSGKRNVNADALSRNVPVLVIDSDFCRSDSGCHTDLNSQDIEEIVSNWSDSGCHVDFDGQEIEIKLEKMFLRDTWSDKVEENSQLLKVNAMSLETPVDWQSESIKRRALAEDSNMVTGKLPHLVAERVCQDNSSRIDSEISVTFRNDHTNGVRPVSNTTRLIQEINGTGSIQEIESNSEKQVVRKVIAVHKNHGRSLASDKSSELSGYSDEESEDLLNFQDEILTPGGVETVHLQVGFGNSLSDKGLYILKRNFDFTRDQVVMKKDNIAHFMSTDCEAKSQLAKLFKSLNYLDFDALKAEEPNLDSVIAIKLDNGTYILNLFVKEHHDEKTKIKSALNSISILATAMEALELKSVRVPKFGDFLSEIPWATAEFALRKVAAEKDFEVTVCTGDVIVPKDQDILGIIIEFHESSVGGHHGVGRTYNRIRERYFWPGMKADITDYVLTCEPCQRGKLSRLKTRLPMAITTTPSAAFQICEYDVVGPCPMTENGNRFILTVMDNLTKYGLAIPLSDVTAQTVAEALAEHLICIYGAPLALKSDLGSNFTSELIKRFSKIFKIHQYNSTAFHPETQGSIERSHASLVAYLRMFTTEMNWDRWLPHAMFSYNTSVHTSHGMTPFELIFGHKANIPSEFEIGAVEKTYNQLLDELINRLRDTQSLAHDRLLAAKEKSKQWYDQKVNPVNFKIGDEVWLLKEPRDNKFDDYYRPRYKVKGLSDHNVTLDLGDGREKVVHKNKLKLAFLRYHN